MAATRACKVAHNVNHTIRQKQGTGVREARAQARTVVARAWAGAWEGLTQVASQAPERMVTYGEVLADSTVKEIIYAIEPRHRYRLARDLWLHSEHWWLIQIIVPIHPSSTRAAPSDFTH